MPSTTPRAKQSLKEIIEQYLEGGGEVIRPLGKTKWAKLLALADGWLGGLADCDITSQRLAGCSPGAA